MVRVTGYRIQWTEIKNMFSLTYYDWKVFIRKHWFPHNFFNVKFTTFNPSPQIPPNEGECAGMIFHVILSLDYFSLTFSDSTFKNSYTFKALFTPIKFERLSVKVLWDLSFQNENLLKQNKIYSLWRSVTSSRLTALLALQTNELI